MKVSLEIPDKYHDQKLSVLRVENDTLILLGGNRELLAFKYPWDSFWYVKTVSCNNCGECCMDISNNWLVKPDDEGKCEKLVKEGDKWMCRAGHDTPVRCIPDPLQINSPNCCIEYEKQEIE